MTHFSSPSSLSLSLVDPITLSRCEQEAATLSSFHWLGVEGDFLPPLKRNLYHDAAVRPILTSSLTKYLLEIKRFKL